MTALIHIFHRLWCTVFQNFAIAEAKGCILPLLTSDVEVLCIQNSTASWDVSRLTLLIFEKRTRAFVGNSTRKSVKAADTVQVADIFSCNVVLDIGY